MIKVNSIKTVDCNTTRNQLHLKTANNSHHSLEQAPATFHAPRF